MTLREARENVTNPKHDEHRDEGQEPHAEVVRVLEVVDGQLEVADRGGRHAGQGAAKRQSAACKGTLGGPGGMTAIHLRRVPAVSQ